MGGMAVVYKATHKNQARFAIKMLLPEISLDEELRTRFLREGYPANAVKHPNGVSIVDEDVTEDGAAFLVMELLDGLSAEDLLERCGRLPVAMATTLGIQVLDVLAAAHEHGILHRDIKPANVFVTRNGTIKVLDFGIARVRDLATTSARLTATGVSFGTPAFMSPEQARGRTREIREQTDLFAVGASLYTLISGKLVHESETSAEAMIKAATEPPGSIVNVAPDVPPPIAEVIDRALAFSADARWPSAIEMRDALLAAHRACFGEPSSADVAAFCTSFAGMSRPAVDVDAETRRVEGGPPIPAAVGGTTAAPLSTDRPRVGSHRPRGAMFAAIVGVVVAVVVAGAAGVALTIARSSSPNVETTPPVLAVPSPPPTTPASSPSLPIATAVESAIPVTDLPVAATSARQGSARPAAKPSARPAASAPNCNPNYVLDADGHKHFKPECF